MKGRTPLGARESITSWVSVKPFDHAQRTVVPARTLSLGGGRYCACGPPAGVEAAEAVALAAPAAGAVIGSPVVRVQCSSGVRPAIVVCGLTIQFASCVGSPSAQLIAVCCVAAVSLFGPSAGQAGYVSGSFGSMVTAPLSEKQLSLPSPS